MLSSIMRLPTLLNQVQSSEMAELMRSSGKIYVVVSVLSIIFAGIVIYLILLDRKINKVEKMLNDTKKKK